MLQEGFPEVFLVFSPDRQVNRRLFFAPVSSLWVLERLR